jgi:hypothetical protein
MKASHKLQEKLADRFSFIQYPNVRPADQATRQASRTGLRFTHAMPIGKRIDLFLLSTLLLVIGVGASAAVLFFLYVLLF